MSKVSVRLPHPTDGDNESLDEFKQHAVKQTAADRDDSGNSSDSSSSEQLPLSDRIQKQKQQQQPEQQQQQQQEYDGYGALPVMQAHETVHDRPWQSADVLLEVSGYVPLHKTVCCALCRKKQARQLKLKLDTLTSNSSPSYYLKDAALVTSDDDNNNNSNSSTVEVSQNGTPLLGDDNVDGDVLGRYSPTPLDEFDSPISRRADGVANTSDYERESMTPSNDVDRFDEIGETDSCDNGANGADVSSESLAGSSRHLASEPSIANFDRTNSSSDNVSSSGGSSAVRKQRSAPRNVNRSATTLRTAQEVCDPVLAHALRSSSYVKHGGLITPQDEKRLTLMAVRKQQEREQQMMRETTRQNSQQQTLLRRSSSINATHNTDVSRRSHHPQPHQHQQHLVCRASSSRSSSECLCQRCLTHGAADRKEQCLDEQRFEMENYIRQLQEKQQEDTRRVTLLRQEKHALIAQKAEQKHRRIRMTVENAKEQERLEQEELLNFQETLEETLSAAELKSRKRREDESAMIKAELQLKIEKSKQKQTHMENELKRWQEEIVTYREAQEKHARAAAQAHIDRRRENAAREREMREKQQKDNLLRMQEQEREWKANLEAAIKSKEARSKMLLHEKETSKKQAKQMATLSRQMRDDLRLNTTFTSEFNQDI